MNRTAAIGALVLAIFVTGACSDNEDDDNSAFVVVPGGPSGEVFGITANNILVNFNAGTPGTLASAVAITGLQSGEICLSIDFRTGTGQLFTVTSQSRIYTIDTATGVATAVSQTPLATAVAGMEFDIDFNPTVDRIRLVSDGDQNLRLNPTTAAVASTDTMLTFAPGDANAASNPTIVAAAYDRSFPGTTATTLYVVDSELNILGTQGSLNSAPVSPNTGQIMTVAALGVDVGPMTGFDISAVGGAIIATALTGATQSTIYSLNLSDGSVTLLGTVGAPPLRDIALRPPTLPRVFGLTAANQLVSFRPSTPGQILATTPITGLGGGESLVGIDFRPATGTLYGVGSTSQVYTIDTTTGAATAIGTAFTPALSGGAQGVDFNPVPDRIRVVGNDEQNLRLNPNTGAIAGTDTALAFAATDANVGVNPNVVAVAYDRSFMGTSGTTLYAIDTGVDALVTQGSLNSSPVSPNTGQLFTVGALGINADDATGFDISPLGGAMAVMTPNGGAASLYNINLVTGAAVLVGTLGDATVRDIAIEPPQSALVYGVTVSNALISFISGQPGVILSNTPITGLATGESIQAIDFRPSTRELIAVGSTSRIYRVNRTTGLATRIGAAQLSPLLSGNAFGADFNPESDRLRLISDFDQNLRINPNTAAVAATDAAIQYDATSGGFGTDPAFSACAYDFNFSGSSIPTLFAIDPSRDLLATIGSRTGAPTSPNTGVAFDVGPLGVDASDVAGFDISIVGSGIACITPVGATTSNLYTVNLNPATVATNVLTLVGAIGTTDIVRDVAFFPPNF